MYIQEGIVFLLLLKVELQVDLKILQIREKSSGKPCINLATYLSISLINISIYFPIPYINILRKEDLG